MLVLYLLIGVLIVGIISCVACQWVTLAGQNKKPYFPREDGLPRNRRLIERELDILYQRYQHGKLTEEQFQQLTDQLIDELGMSLNNKAFMAESVTGP